MTDKKRILYDSPEAASVQTVTGWVSSRGMFCGNDEHMARHHGSTHRVCEKGIEEIGTSRAHSVRSCGMDQ